MNANQSFTPALPRPSKSALCSAFVGADLATLRTPAPIIDRAIARRNCVRMLEIARDWKVNSSSIDVEKATEGAEFRAHVKTHKTLEATLLQLQPDAEHQPELKTGRAIVSTIPEAWGLLEENEANDDADVARMKHLLEDVSRLLYQEQRCKALTMMHGTGPLQPALASRQDQRALRPSQKAPRIQQSRL